MSLQQKLMDDLKAAMKSGDKLRQSVIRMLRAKIKNAEIEKRGALDDGEVIKAITRDVKQHKESITAFREPVDTPATTSKSTTRSGRSSTGCAGSPSPASGATAPCSRPFSTTSYRDSLFQPPIGATTRSAAGAAAAPRARSRTRCGSAGA